MKKKYWMYLAVVAGLVLVFYTYIGGFTNVTVMQTQSTPLIVAGKPFEGNTDSEELGQIYEQVGKSVEQKQLAGDFAGIFYNNPSPDTKTVKAFIGVAIQDSTVALPAGFSVRVVPGGRPVLRGELDATIAIAPRRIYAALFDYAKENTLTLQEFYVERFPQGKPAVIEVAVAPK
jgi:effector-binding domain-containing protein